MEDIIIGIENKQFKGLKFIPNFKFREEEYNDLLKDDNFLNRLKYKNMIQEELSEKIHIKLSIEFVLKYIAGFLLGISLLMAIYQISFLATIIIFFVSLVSKIISSYFTNEIIIQNAILNQCNNIVDLIFNSE